MSELELQVVKRIRVQESDVQQIVKDYKRFCAISKRWDAGMDRWIRSQITRPNVRKHFPDFVHKIAYPHFRKMKLLMSDFAKRKGWQMDQMKEAKELDRFKQRVEKVASVKKFLQIDGRDAMFELQHKLRSFHFLLMLMYCAQRLDFTLSDVVYIDVMQALILR